MLQSLFYGGSVGYFLIRADASLEMGTGHVMRCLTLANALVERGHDCHFVCRKQPGNLAKTIKQNGFGLTILSMPQEPGNMQSKLAHAAWLGCSQEQDAEQVIRALAKLGITDVDCLVVDHYALDITWEKILRARVGRLMVIDDLFDRQHYCDIIVNQNLGTTTEQYQELVPQGCHILAGISYAMLRPEFVRFRQQSLEYKSKPHPKQLLITMGGVDPDNYTGRILQKLKACNSKLLEKIVVVLGETAPHRASVEHHAAELPFDVEIKVAVNNMAEIMAQADVAFGAAGSTSWERCCLGLPTMLFVIADNQAKVAKLLEQHDAIVAADINADAERFVESLMPLLQDCSFYRARSKAAALLCDGRGIDRVVSSLQVYLPD